MESSSFNLEQKINSFLENFNQTANNAIEEDFVFDNSGMIRSRSRGGMNDALEMAGKH